VREICGITVVRNDFNRCFALHPEANWSQAIRVRQSPHPCSSISMVVCVFLHGHVMCIPKISSERAISHANSSTMCSYRFAPYNHLVAPSGKRVGTRSATCRPALSAAASARRAFACLHPRSRRSWQCFVRSSTIDWCFSHVHLVPGCAGESLSPVLHRVRTHFRQGSGINESGILPLRRWLEREPYAWPSGICHCQTALRCLEQAFAWDVSPVVITHLPAVIAESGHLPKKKGRLLSGPFYRSSRSE